MATIRQKAKRQWQVLIRRKGWPQRSRTFLTKRDAQNWANEMEIEIYRNRFDIPQTDSSISLADLIEIYLEEVTAKRPREESRLRRFLREEKVLCSYHVRNLRPEHFIDYRDRRLTEHTPRNVNKTIASGTVKRDLTLLKGVLNYQDRKYGMTTSTTVAFLIDF